MSVRRRTFLRVLGGAGAAPLVGGCSQPPPERMLPYVVAPEDAVPGVATWYATVCRECPAGCGLHVRTREGRAVKLEGNPEHPVNRGALCARGQASLQGLYNPDRWAGPRLRRRAAGASGRGGLAPASWDDAQAALVARIRELREKGRADRIALVTPLLTGALDRLFDSFLGAIGSRRRLRYEPFAYEAVRAANRLAFSQDAVPFFDFSRARMILSFGADFLETWLSNVGYARLFREARSRVEEGRRCPFVHVEPRLSLTAANADEWISAAPGTEALLALSMVHAILEEALAAPLPAATTERLKALVRDHAPEAVASGIGLAAGRIRTLARAFAAARPGLAVGGGVSASGSNATPTLVAVNLLNYVAGNVGRTVVFGPDAAYSRAGTHRDMLALTESMRAGELELLVVHEANPAFALSQAGFAEAMERVPFVASLASFPDETSERADVVLPTHTPLESWGDYEPRLGVRGLMQPAMRPLLDTRHAGDILLATARGVGEKLEGLPPEETFRDYLRADWERLRQRAAPGEEPEGFWAAALRRGGFFEEVPARAVELSPELPELRFEPARLRDERRPLVLLPYASLLLHDGRGANRPWLQEIPDPLVQASWETWAEMHPQTCARLGAEAGQLVSIESASGRIDVPLLPNPHLRPDVVAVPIGQGHAGYGRYAGARGADVRRLLPAEAEEPSGGPLWLSTRVTVTPRPVRRALPIAQAEGSQHGRELARAVPLQSPTAERPHHATHPSLYPPHEHPGHRWGMAIDLDACIGCSACVAACYAENNVPVVGPEQLARGRGMAWLRIDRYFEGSAESPDARFLPMLCQHCDNAPCESVCPVYATYHSPEGLNAQVYNRCVGTRYCSNNCPYKVRRFGWLEYPFPEPLNLQLNPDVTVRTLGVMEKCTFCVQRIAESRDRAKDQGRPLRDGEVVPACAQTCPAQAIRFGDLNDPASAVSRAKGDARAYHVLDELNTRPAITYLKKIVSGPVSGA